MFYTLSKSDYKAARDCPTRLYYRELGYPSVSDDDEYLELLAEGGYMVEELARLQFEGGIRPDRTGDQKRDAEITREFMESDPVTLFEATFLSGRRLARVDILRRQGSKVEIFEVKASLAPVDAAERRARTGSPLRSLRKSSDTGTYPIASDWLEYLEDVTFQVAVLRDACPELTIRPHLILIDPAYRAAIDDLPDCFTLEHVDDARVAEIRFVGHPAVVAELPAYPMMMVVDVSAEVAELEPGVRARARDLEASLGDTVQRIASPLGVKKCRSCEFRTDGERSGFRECWGKAADAGPLLIDLYKASDWCDPLLAAGKTALQDAEPLVLSRTVGSDAARQLIQIQYTRAGREWIGDELRAALATVSYPLQFVDFETSRLAVPYLQGMRPYELAAFQWSVHSVSAPGAAPVHREWLNDDASWPNLAFVTSLRLVLGEKGTILTWASHERSTLRQIREELEEFRLGSPDLLAWIDDVLGGGRNPGRIVDLNVLTLRGYFHPGMAGRTSIKVVLEALWKAVPEVRRRFEEITGRPAHAARGPYASLAPIEMGGVPQDVADGTGAMRAYQAMMYGEEGTDPARRAAWRYLLLQYCELDTLAMLLIWEHWLRVGAVTPSHPIYPPAA